MLSSRSVRPWFLLVVYFAFSVLGTAKAVEVEKIVPDKGSRNDSPAIAFDADGTLWIAWSSYQDGKYRLAVTSHSMDGKESLIRYPDDSTTDQVDPVWAFPPEGTPKVIYAAHDGRKWTIRKVACPKRGLQLAPEVIGHGTHPTAVIADRRLWITWEQDPNLVILTPNEKEIIVKRTVVSKLRHINKKVKPTKTILKPKDGMARLSSPVLAAGPDGAVWLAWEAARTGYRSIQLQRIDEPGHKVAVIDDGRDVNRHPSMSVDADGRVWLVFERLHKYDPQDTSSLPKTKGPKYILDWPYRVTKPSNTLVVTDGVQFWTPEKPGNPAWGLAPTVHCSKTGPVWLLSRFHNRFAPMCESLGTKGWHNYDRPWSTSRSYKKPMPMAASPDGRLWTAWIEQHRERTGFKKAPAWSVLDGPDTIMVAQLPKCETPGAPQLVAKDRPAAVAAPVVTLPKYSTEYQGHKLNVYFGDLHVHTEFSGCGRTNGAIEEDVAYSRDVRGLDFFAPGDHAEHLNDHNWHETLMAERKLDRPGHFVPFMAFEWTSEFDRDGSLYRGHYNGIFRQLGKGECYISASDPQTNTPLEMWEALRRAVGGPENVLTFGHHTSRRYAWLSWCYYDPEMAPLIEIAQTRGSFEYEGCPQGSRMAGDCGRVSGHFIQDGLNRGMRFGIASSGDHGGQNLIAIFASKLDRDSLFKAMRAKRVYGTNGPRIFLDARVNGHFMGEEFRLASDKPRTIVVRAQGTRPLTHVDLFRNGRVIRNWNCHSNKAFRGTFVDSEPLIERENYYYVRVMQQGDGMAWSSPTWVVNKDVPGQFRFQVGGDELHVIYPGQETDFSILVHNETDEPVKGLVDLDVPMGWKVKVNPIQVKCPAGGWRHVVFNVTAPKSALTEVCLPEVTTSCHLDNGNMYESTLFVVSSPKRISRENKCKLIDARADLTPKQFEQYVEKMTPVLMGQ